jgi:hypothetical protein
MNTVLNKVVLKFAELNIQNSNLKLESIPLNKLTSNKNLVRMGGEDQNCIDDIANLIKNNKYDTNNFIPPIVEKDGDDDCYTIVSGHHRYKAHKVANQKEMICVIANFSSDSDRTVWRVHENCKYNENYVKNTSNDTDHVNSILYLMQNKKNGIEPNRQSIEEFIDRSKITKNNVTKTKIVNNILANIGKFDKQYYKTLTSADVKSYVDEISDDVPNVKFIPSIFGPDKNDYIARTFAKCSASFIENPTNRICIPYSISGATDSQKVIEYRQKVAEEFKDMFESARKIIELENEGHNFINQVDFMPLPQLPDEIKNEKDGGLGKCFDNAKSKYTKTKKSNKKKSFDYIDVDTIVLLCKKMESDPKLKKQVNKILNETL